jgi:hypothetical protein
MVVNVSDDIIVNGVLYDASKTSVPRTSLVAPGQTAKGGSILLLFIHLIAQRKAPHKGAPAPRRQAPLRPA